MCSSSVNTFPLSTHNIAVVLLAAGSSKRMGGPTSKLLLPLKDGKPLISHSIENALSLEPLEMVVVVRPDLLPQIESLHPSFNYVPNPRYEEGMGTSLAIGVSSLSADVEACLVLLGDEPEISRGVVDRLVRAYLADYSYVTIPVYGEQPGPPTLFSRYAFPDLSQLERDTGGRQLLARFPDKVTRVRFDENQRPKDIDTPEDYRALT